MSKAQSGDGNFTLRTVIVAVRGAVPLDSFQIMVTMMVSFKWLWCMTRRGVFLLDRGLATEIRVIPKTT